MLPNKHVFFVCFRISILQKIWFKKKTWRKLGQKTCIPTISLITCLLGASSYGWLLPGYIQGTEAFSRSCPPRTACSLCCRSLWDGRNQQGLHTNSRVVDLATKWEFLWRNPQLEWKLILNSIYTKLKTPWKPHVPWLYAPLCKASEMTWWIPAFCLAKPGSTT